MAKCSVVVFLLIVFSFRASTLADDLQITQGYNCVFMGHSFFEPMAGAMPQLTEAAGIVGHQQMIVFNGGEKGTPGWFWDIAVLRDTIQNQLETGEVNLVGMTYHPDGKVACADYERWIQYALNYNIDTRFFIAMPWPRYPSEYTLNQYAQAYEQEHALIHRKIDTLRSNHPSTGIYCIPYGQSALELRALFEKGQLPEVDVLILNPDARTRTPVALSKSMADTTAIFSDYLGHPENILKSLGQLVWLAVIYGVDMETFNWSTGTVTDLKEIAQRIADGATYGPPTGTTHIHGLFGQSSVPDRSLPSPGPGIVVSGSAKGLKMSLVSRVQIDSRAFSFQGRLLRQALRLEPPATLQTDSRGPAVFGSDGGQSRVK